MPKIYTKTGDKGKTSTLDGKRVDKSCLEMEAIGEVDELNANLGLLVAELAGVVCEEEHEHESEDCADPYTEVRIKLVEVQNNLFVVGSNLATLQTNVKKVPKLGKKDVVMLEKWIDEMTNDLPELKNFILPGGDLAAAQSYLTRAVCRRAERCMIKLSEKYSVSLEIKQYLNRLSDCLFVLARWINWQSGVVEVKWKK